MVTRAMLQRYMPCRSLDHESAPQLIAYPPWWAQKNLFPFDFDNAHQFQLIAMTPGRDPTG